MPISNFPFTDIGDGFARPFLLTRIVNPLNGYNVLCFGLVDTGADDCAVPASFAKSLGHDLLAGSIRGIDTGNGTASAYAHTVKFEILHPVSQKPLYAIQDTPVDFMQNLPLVLLGTKNFLSRFILTIDYPRKSFSIKHP
jgi:predicted aspartyl protease